MALVEYLKTKKELMKEMTAGQAELIEILKDWNQFYLIFPWLILA